MPIIKSAKKRVRVARKATVRNVKTKRSLKTALKAFHAAVTSGSKTADKAHRSVQSAVDIAAKKGVMHKNKAARKKRQLSAAAKAAGTKKTTAKKTTTKPAAKSTAKNKAAPKKSAAKKTTKK